LKEMTLAGRTGNSRIFIGAALEDLGDYGEGRRTILLVDSNVARLYPGLVSGHRWVDAGRGETAKSLENIEKICRRLLEFNADRSTALVGIGGGVACDITGFVASIFMRGLRFGFAPTTLLAQADAAIGGKNAVNLDGYKNIIGVFNQPEFVLLDFDVLRSLPDREVLCGAAEIVKHALVGDAGMFSYLEANGRRLLALERDTLEEVVRRSVELKIKVVSADEKEAGERRKLNFGHTLAHALEKAFLGLLENGPEKNETAGLSHGEAVAVGMAFAARVSLARGLLSSDVAERIESLLRSLGLPVKTPVAGGLLLEAVWKDKKREAEALRFVLLEDIGKPVIAKLGRKELEGYLHDLC
jgi:3-dehydroquinate synthase